MTLPQVDVVILTWNDGPMLDVALRSALDSEGVDVHVTVVDNGSEPPATVPDDPRVTLVRNEVNRGVAGGRNQGIQSAGRPFVCLLDSDARLHPGGLRLLLRPLLENDAIGLSAPTYAGQRPEATAGRRPTLARKALRGLNVTAHYSRTPRPAGAPWWRVDFAIGACQLFRREAYGAVGRLDESIFYGPEDVDFCLRLAEAGWDAVQLRDEVCDHPARRRFKKVLTRRGAQHAVAVARFLWRHRRDHAHAS
ncbi:MAG: glycosyltransferase family 2 protein [Acidimicrobiales bacterium]